MQLNSIENQRQQFCLVWARKHRRTLTVTNNNSFSSQLSRFFSVHCWLDSLTKYWFFSFYDLQSATEWVETLRPTWTFWCFPDFKRGKASFLSPIPSCNVVPLFELPLKNKKHPNVEWRGQGRGVDSYVLWSYPIWVQSPNNFVASLSICKFVWITKVVTHP